MFHVRSRPKQAGGPATLCSWRDGADVKIAGKLPYESLEQIGQGSFGLVYRARCRDGFVAVKQFAESRDAVEELVFQSVGSSH